MVYGRRSDGYVVASNVPTSERFLGRVAQQLVESAHSDARTQGPGKAIPVAFPNAIQPGSERLREGERANGGRFALALADLGEPMI